MKRHYLKKKIFQSLKYGRYYWYRLHTRVCKDFDIRKLCLKIYDLDPTYFLSTTGLVWQAAFKKTKNLLTDVVMC